MFRVWDLPVQHFLLDHLSRLLQSAPWGLELTHTFSSICFSVVPCFSWSLSKSVRSCHHPTRKHQGKGVKCACWCVCCASCTQQQMSVWLLFQTVKSLWSSHLELSNHTISLVWCADFISKQPTCLIPSKWCLIHAHSSVSFRLFAVFQNYLAVWTAPPRRDEIVEYPWRLKSQTSTASL